MPSDLPNEPKQPGNTRARALGTFERAQLLTSESSPFNLVASLRIEGSLDRDRLRSALDALQRRHPSLALRLVGKPAAARLEVGDVPSIPLQILSRGRETSWIAAVENELGMGFDRSTGPLVRCCFLESDGDDQCQVILTFHHVIVDAASAGQIIDDLLELCGAESRAAEFAETLPELPPSADVLFPRGHRGAASIWPSLRFLVGEMAREIAYRWRTRAHRASPRYSTLAGEPPRSRILPVAFSESETESLVRATRGRRLTLNSALNAALLLAVVRHRYPGTELPHRYFVFPTLRPYLDPPIPEGSDGSYLTTLRLMVRTSGTRDLWDLAEEIQNQVHHAGKEGGKFLATRFSEMSMKMILSQSNSRMSTTALSYTGYPFRVQHGALRLVEVHAFVSNLPVGPEYTAQARVFRDRLWLDILYLNVDMTESEARAIAEEVRRVLLASPHLAHDSEEKAR